MRGLLDFAGIHPDRTMRLAAVAAYRGAMETSARSDTPPPFFAPQVFLSDSRLVLALLNHLRYQALNRVFGTSREQANLLTIVLLLGAADRAYEATRRISGMRPRVSDAGIVDAGIVTIALREAGLGLAGPGARQVPGFGALVAFGLLGGLAIPGLRRMARRMRAAERRVRRARIRRYAAERDRLRSSLASAGSSLSPGGSASP